VSTTHAPDRGDDEPDQLREQFRHLLRYRWLIGGGIGIGLLAGAWLGVLGTDSYAASTDIVLRAPTNDPFDPAGSADRTINMGSERQTALSSSVAQVAARKLGTGTAGLQQGLQVTNPPQTLVLHLTYTAGTSREAARRANALTTAYLDLRTRQWEGVRDSMVKKYRDQLTPLTKQHDDITGQIARLPKDGSAANSAYAVQANLLNRITELNGRISNLNALDMTPGTVIRRAVPPAAPEGPGLPMSLGLGGAVGIALGLLGAWVRLVFDPLPRSVGEVARAVRAPVLGVLPRGGTGALLLGGQPDARIAEEYRSIAFRLAYDDRFADRRRLLVVAPRGDIDATVAVASNLAASFAETGKDVLLVEADLRTPSLVGLLRATTHPRPQWTLPEPGTHPHGTAVRTAPGPGDTDWPGGGPLAVDAGESGMFALVPGERVRNVPRALTSPRMTRLIAEADDPRSTVVVLAPPVLAYADALALVDRVDGVLVVCDPRAVHRADLARIRELISGAGGTVLGAVVHTGHPRRTALGHRAKAARTAPAPEPAPGTDPDDLGEPDDPGDPQAPYGVPAADR
jgi:Mrp family chromosome partitioning ATPase/capsular polysaccharide biosynthesis protein